MLYLYKYTMKLVKLNAINSTNEFLKNLMKDSLVENWTVVMTENQTHGKGQFKNMWQSESGKNLTFSVLCRFKNFKISNSFFLNAIVSLAVYNVLSDYIPNKLKVKWPNDILSASKKLCGILIENTVNSNHIVSSVIGIGLNVNQTNFEDLPMATSLKTIIGSDINKDILLSKIVVELKKQVLLLEKQSFRDIKNSYESHLYKMQIPSMYEDKFGNKFMGKIQGINNQGLLILELENENIQTFDLKEIKFI